MVNMLDPPSSSPKLNGSLVLQGGGIISRLLHLPGGLHFTRIEVSCTVEDAKLVPDLVSRCANTLESLELEYCACAFPSTPVADE